ncbi:MAG: hypothetical protein M1503_08000 [Thaumarchaeota archaeon]|nr:hypothetical protein [Nitrososphaerota archaeon]MCL5318182.1 hypothetical protein [Nitrososphaerota archaeon]
MISVTSEPHNAGDIVEICLLSVEQWLTQNGYKVEKNTKITGKAGIVHDIGFYAENLGEGRLIVSPRPLGSTIFEEDVVRLFAICLDVGASGILITAQPKITNYAVKLADLYRISIIDASSQDNPVSVVQELLGRNKQSKGPQSLGY